MTYPDPTSQGSTAAAQSIRVLALAVLGAPVLMAIVVWFAVVPASEDLPVWVVAAEIAVVVTGWLTAQTVGFRTEPLTSSDGPDVALERFRTGMMLRFAVTEAPIILAMALTFMLPYGAWPFLAALVLGLPLMVHQVWPSRRVVTKVASQLESGGTQSGLLDTFSMR